MRWDLLVTMVPLLCLLLSLPAHGQNEGPIAYQPDIIGVDRLFMVALKVPAAAPEIKITCPDSITLLDRTPLPARSDLRKYYFRSLKPADQADIVFAHPAGEITISIQIWSFEDLRQFREFKGVQLPRRWPLGEELPELKESQTITTEQMKQALQGSAGADRWLALSDEEIWAMQPDSTIPRWHWVNVSDGCPVHGTEIYKSRAFYPWGKNSQVPFDWKIECPVGHEKYPSNDFANDDFTSGEFPDDGIGGACEYGGNKYGFIAELCQQYCHVALGVAPQCARAYVGTGEVRYLHKCLVAMCRIAAEYAYLATMTQHRHRNRRTQVDRLGPAPFSEGPCLGGTGFTIYSISQPPYQSNYAEAYDMIWPDLDKDPEIIPFLQSRGFTDIKTHEDVRRFIEENLFAVWMQGALDGATSSNQPSPQMGMVRIAECLNYRRGDEFMDWLYDGPGMMCIFVPNTYFRDGAPYEATGNYNGHHLRSLAPIIESVEHLRQMRPEVYPEDRYPDLTKSRRYHNIFDFAMDTVTIDRTYPKIGDDTAGRGYNGGFPQYLEQERKTWHSANTPAFEHIYKVTQDPKFAWALAKLPGWQPSSDFPYTREQVEEAAANWPDDWNDRSCLQDGYGLGILRSGEGAAKRAFWIFYGHARSHTHDDIMHIGLDAHKSEILGQMGYPRNWGYWEACWTTHNLARQFPYVQMTATSQLFADAGPLHISEAFARGFSDQVDEGAGYQLLPDSWQRRMLALVDVADDQFYCLDLYRIHGGEEHWWSFHAQEGDFTTGGIDLTEQGGTVAGPEVPYGDPEWLKANGCSKHATYGWRGLKFALAHLYNVQRGTSENPWWADWALKDAGGLHFRMTVPRAEGTEVAICDGKSPAGASPYEMKWVLLHNQAEPPTKTQVTNVMELYNAEPVIKSVRPLELSGDDEAGFAPYGCVIELADGRTDTIFASADGTVPRSAEGGFGFAGRFGLWRERDGVVESAVLVGGTRLTKQGVGVTMPQAEYRAEITAVDRATETITVSPAPTNLAGLVGSYIYLTNPVRRIAYKVLAAEAVGGAAQLRLEFDSRIGTGKVTGHDDHSVKTATPFRLSRWRYYHGARLVNADRTAEYRLIGVRDQAIIDSQVHPECPAEKLEAEFPVGTWFDVYDYGVGDEVVWPQAANVTQVSPATYKVTATGAVTLSLPQEAGTRLAGH